MDTNITPDTTLRNFNEINVVHTWSSFERYGPPHMPTFKVDLILNNTKYEGCGSSKKKAKINAIQKCILSLNGDIKPSIASDATKGLKRDLDDDSTETGHPRLLKKSAVDTVTQTSAISILHEIFPGQNFVYEHEPSHGLLESMSVMVFGSKYIGYGKNKREAKEIACRNALKAIYEVHPMDNKFKEQIEILRTDYQDAKIIDYFASLTDTVYQQFDNIKSKEYSVIASIIKVNNQLFVHLN